MKRIGKMKSEQTIGLIDLLWDHLKKDPTNSERVQTGWGNKTKEGLVECIKSLERPRQQYAQVVVCVDDGLVQSIFTDKPDSISVEVIDTTNIKDPNMKCIY